MSVLTVDRAVVRPRRVVVRRVVRPVSVVLNRRGNEVPAWVAPGCRGDELFGVLAKLTFGEAGVCLLASSMPVGVRVRDLTLDEAAGWALEGLRLLGTERVAALDVEYRATNLVYETVKRAASDREFSRVLDRIGGGVLAGARRRDTAARVGYLLMSGITHGAGKCAKRGCRHCYPQPQAGRVAQLHPIGERWATAAEVLAVVFDHWHLLTGAGAVGDWSGAWLRRTVAALFDPAHVWPFTPDTELSLSWLRERLDQDPATANPAERLTTEDVALLHRLAALVSDTFGPTGLALPPLAV